MTTADPAGRAVSGSAIAIGLDRTEPPFAVSVDLRFEKHCGC